MSGKKQNDSSIVQNKGVEIKKNIFDGKIQYLPLDQLADFKNHPFKVEMNTELFELMQSIEKEGVLVPLLARPNLAGEGYELIAGHRRKAASKWAGVDKVPVMVAELDDNQAVIAMVDSNLQREHIKPSEKAFAYRMRLEAMKQQVGESQRQINRYIRLTYLIPQILDMVDEEKIAFTVAVELSYLNEEEQYELHAVMDMEQCTPSLSQANRLKRMSQSGTLDMDAIYLVMEEEKPNQREQIRIRSDRLNPYFPEDYTDRQKIELIENLVKEWHREQVQSKSR